ncbi:ankyrin repeat/ATP synthase domain-containing protein [Chaetoceros tenuissimus]|uniref:Ankyrin repeat/ATP synthase domain-containing protein n=1 Tax=Chaetoceros tenuissimus TaxID=426638 RepID=A0AAD3HB67_9STRA|nr:ankyrin repeat/ATP synthase domain-containing protein [Chaetoceros tenuissimus]
MHCRNAIEHGSIDCLKYLHEDANCALDNTGFCTIAARRGNVEILTYLRENGCEWNQRECCRVAIEENHFKCLKFLIENGCSMDVHAEECFRMAVRVGSVECFQYFHDKKFSWNARYCTSASVSRWCDLDCLKYLLENGFKLDLDEADYLGIVARCQDAAYHEKNCYLDRYYCYGEGMIGAWKVFNKRDEVGAKVKAILPMIAKTIP